MPIIINQGERQSHAPQAGFPDLIALRDLISQAVSTQLQLHNIRQEHHLTDDKLADLNPADDSL